jgi:hypothetical protein
MTITDITTLTDIRTTPPRTAPAGTTVPGLRAPHERSFPATPAREVAA